MHPSQDPTYLHLYHEYARAAVAFDNALKDRERARASLKARHTLASDQRRPVGAPPMASTAPAFAPQASMPPTQQRQEQVFYLGPILGYAKLVASSSPTGQADDPIADFDAGQIYDRVSLELYWNAKSHYERAKSAFFEYVRRQNRDLQRQQAAAALGHAAQLQLLGVDSSAEYAIEDAQQQIENACQAAWHLYQSSPSPKSHEAKVLLLESLADAQLLGIEDRPVGKLISEEANRLFAAGDLSHG